MIAAAGEGAGARLRAGRLLLLLAPLAGQITLWHRCINTENIASIITVNKSQLAPKTIQTVKYQPGCHYKKRFPSDKPALKDEIQR